MDFDDENEIPINSNDNEFPIPPLIETYENDNGELLSDRLYKQFDGKPTRRIFFPVISIILFF
jgi:hypothetical protein